MSIYNAKIGKLFAHIAVDISNEMYIINFEYFYAKCRNIVKQIK
jgi:hypothetical protein